jgi:hypothetical protein
MRHSISQVLKLGGDEDSQLNTLLSPVVSLDEVSVPTEYDAFLLLFVVRPLRPLSCSGGESQTNQ